ncbi:MAG: hypothetical protein P1U89_21905 [Verrucomicrobiales bacterium]|nr:hypothetical protein [Verrucomicrobiales bacterium]
MSVTQKNGNTERSVTDLAAADDKAIGFEYQYYYFLYKVLSLNKGESAGLEVKDDVHTELSDNHQILVQLKHTVQADASGKPINLTTLDSDLWKTLSNWSKIISDAKAARKDLKAQLSFVKKTEFLLVSNKSETKGNAFMKALDKPPEARKIVEGIRKSATGPKTIEFIDDVLSLDDEVLEHFIRRIRINLGEDEVVRKCKDAIESCKIRPDRVDHIFRDLDSQIRQDNFIAVRNGEKIRITFSEFQKKYRCYFDRERSADLVIRDNYKSFPDALAEQTFIKQLIDIGDLSLNDVGRMASFTEYMLCVECNLEVWGQQGELTPDEIEKFKSEVQLHWDNNFRSFYRGEKNDDSIALMLLDEIRKVYIRVSGVSMDLSFSNGGFYLISNIPEIGWLKNWEEKYK